MGPCGNLGKVNCGNSYITLACVPGQWVITHHWVKDQCDGSEHWSQGQPQWRETDKEPVFCQVVAEVFPRPSSATQWSLYFLWQMSSVSPVGTLAFVVEEEALLVRVEAGWQYVAVSTLSISVYLSLFLLRGLTAAWNYNGFRAYKTYKIPVVHQREEQPWAHLFVLAVYREYKVKQVASRSLPSDTVKLSFVLFYHQSLPTVCFKIP